MRLRRAMMMAGAAMLAMQTAPALAACQDNLERIETRLQDSDIRRKTRFNLQNTIDTARKAAENNNEVQCAQLVKKLRDDLESEGLSNEPDNE